VPAAARTVLAHPVQHAHPAADAGRHDRDRPWRVVFRMTRSSVLEVLERDYVRAAHAKGLDPRRIIVHHVVRKP